MNLTLYRPLQGTVNLLRQRSHRKQSQAWSAPKQTAQIEHIRLPYSELVSFPAQIPCSRGCIRYNSKVLRKERCIRDLL